MEINDNNKYNIISLCNIPNINNDYFFWVVKSTVDFACY